MGRDEVGETFVNEGCLLMVQLASCHKKRSSEDQTIDGAKYTYIENIYATFVHKESLEQTLDNHQALSQRQHHGVKPCCATMEDGEKRKLRQEGEGE